MNEGYEYDLFVSYTRQPPVHTWLSLFFGPTLEERLRGELPYRWVSEKENRAALPSYLGGIYTIKFESSIDHEFEEIKKRLIQLNVAFD